MEQPRRIFILVYDGFELLDLSGPVAVFSSANIISAREVYDCVIISLSGGMVTSGSGVSVETKNISRIKMTGAATLLVSGADTEPLIRAIKNQRMAAALRRYASRAGRMGSICSGALLLAAAGLLEGRSATTHWSAQRQLAKYYPAVNVTDDALYTVDGKFWTSAGATSGIDMSLEMLKRDHGAELMRAVAKRLVVYAHRPGRQSQFSTIIDAQTKHDGGFSSLIAWMQASLDKPLTVPALAEKAAMSERTFHRKFTAAIGETPARFLEELRLDQARRLLEDGAPIKEAAAAAGFKSDAGFRAAFQSRYGVTPSMHRSVNAIT